MSSSTPSSSQQPAIQKSFDILNPGGDPDVLYACADAWRGMARGLRTVADSLNQEVTAANSAWTGAAADAFHAHWADTRNQIEDALPRFEQVAEQLEQAGDSIKAANQQIQDIVEEIAATVAVGVGLSIITAGFSDAAAAAGAAAEAAEASAAITRLAAILARIAKVLETIKKLMDDSKLAKFGFDFLGNFGGNMAGDVLGQAFTGQLSWGAVGQDAQDAGVAALAGTGLGALGGAAAGEGESAISKALRSEGLVGNVLMNGSTSAAGQAAADGVDILEGSKHGSDVLPDILTAGASGAAAGAGVRAGEMRLEHGGGGAHRDPKSGVEFGPVRQGIANGVVYGDGNANETDIENQSDNPFGDPHSALTNPKGAFD